MRSGLRRQNNPEPVPARCTAAWGTFLFLDDSPAAGPSSKNSLRSHSHTLHFKTDCRRLLAPVLSTKAKRGCVTGAQYGGGLPTALR